VEIFASEPSVQYSAPNEDWFSLVDAGRERPFRTSNPTVS